MSLRNKSEIDMINGPEFINLEPSDVNPLMSKCQVKAFYLGKNRNGSYINKETAEEMSKTLRGTPIVAAWRKDVEDYGDHGHIMHMEDGKITFSCKTVPYGFVPTDAEVWFQNFIDTDEFDNKIERTYLMTNGYLWTGQFEELDKVMREGQPQSMELDPDSMDGHWAEDSNTGYEFFIITDATFSKLCILGDDVEPCYQGASVTPTEDTKFSLKETDYSNTFFALMEEFTHALQNEGGSDMDDETQENLEEDVLTDEAEESAGDEAAEGSGADEANEAEETDADAEAGEEASENGDNEASEAGDDAGADDGDGDSGDAGDSDGGSDFSLDEYNALVQERDNLKAQVEELIQFKLNIENGRKDELINKYFMLSDEDKADLIAHKSEYTYEEIEAKLALMYVEQNVNFSSIGEETSEDDSISTTFSLNTEDTEHVSPLLGALRRTKH